MRRAVRSQHFWIVLGLFVAFCVGASWLDNQSTLILANSLMLVTSVVVSCSYGPIAWQAIRHRESPTFQHLTVGIWLVATANAIWRLLSLLWLTSGQPPELVNNDLIAGFIAMASLGYLYHTTSPGVFGLSYRRRSLAVAAIVLSAFSFAAWMVVAPPDTRPIAEAIIPWLPR
jgi:hypothetical protein